MAPSNAAERPVNVLAGLPLFSPDAINQGLDPQRPAAPLEALAQILGDPNGSAVFWANQADDMRLPQGGEGKRQRGASAIGRQASPPMVARQHPAELQPRPALRLIEADAADQRTAGAVLDGPHAVAAELPVTEHR